LSMVMQLAKLPSWQDQLAIVSFGLTILGFIIAIWQIRKSIRASEAAARAVRATANRLASNQLLLLIPQLELLDFELDIAIRTNDRESVERTLVRWRYLSSKVRGVLLSVNSDPMIVELLQKSAGLATITKSALQEQAKPLPAATKRVTAAISEVCDEITALSARLSTEPGDGLSNG
jgi:hypothetical protein